MMVRRYSVLFFLLTLLFYGCTTTSTSNTTVNELVGLGNTFRDLRQHTFSKKKETRNSMVDISPNGKNMAFVLDMGGIKNIYIKDPNSRAMTQKTFHKSYDIYPVFSPDGSKLAFASKRNGNWDIFVMNTYSGKAKRQITSSIDHEIAPSWSPDGTKIAFCRLSRSSNQWEIWTYDLKNGALSSLVPGLFPRYSPTKNIIAFQRPINTDKKQNKLFALWTIDDMGTQETVVLSSDKKGYSNPQWSKNGDKLVFTSGGRSQQLIEYKPDSKEISKIINARAGDIWIINADGTNLTQLTSHKASDWGPVWGIDGRIYFTSTRDKFVNIWSVTPEFINFEKN